MKTEAALCAKLIRKDLKQAFPSVKFSVSSENYSMGNSVNITFSDFSVDNRIEGLPQVKFVHVRRNLN